MTSIRVVLSISAASPELLEEMERIPARHRAERIRALATIGLMGTKQGAGVAVGHPSVSNDADVSTDPDALAIEDPAEGLVESFARDFKF